MTKMSPVKMLLSFLLKAKRVCTWLWNLMWRAVILLELEWSIRLSWGWGLILAKCLISRIRRRWELSTVSSIRWFIGHFWSLSSRIKRNFSLSKIYGSTSSSTTSFSVPTSTRTDMTEKRKFTVLLRWIGSRRYWFLKIMFMTNWVSLLLQEVTYWTTQFINLMS